MERCRAEAASSEAWDGSQQSRIRQRNKHMAVERDDARER